MSLTGSAKANETLKGKINGLKTIHGHSAYEIAVINGFSGTEEEWLQSLKGDPGTPGKQGVSPAAEVTPVPGGYHVTITDAAGQSGFVLRHGIQAEYDEETQTLRIMGGGTEGGGESYDLDTTLTIGGAAADAKAVGDAVTALANKINEIELQGGGKGEPGVSCTHYWNGTILTITSASGTSSANLAGAKGNDGVSIDGVSYNASTNKWEFSYYDPSTYLSGVYQVDGPVIPDCYTKEEIDGMLGGYIDEVAGLLGGDA